VKTEVISLFLVDQGAGKSAVLNSLIGHPVLVSCVLNLSARQFVYVTIG
jgi:hypothetical protein